MKKYKYFFSVLLVISSVFFALEAHQVNAQTTGNQKVLVLLIKYLNSGQDPFTQTQAYSRIFSGPFQKFYNEQSYGKISFSGNVYGWYTLQKNIPTDANDLFTDSANDIGQIIKNNHINIGSYQRLVVVVNAPFAVDLSTLGKTSQTINGINYTISKSMVYVTTNNINSPDGLAGQYFSWSYFDDTLSHEIGHALGLVHANGWDCGGESFADSCSSVEYGNPFDVMGGAGSDASLHFNAYFKEILGWIAPSSEITISKSGSYTINPLETSSGIKLAKIRLANGTTPFYLEYRRAIGFDSSLNNYQVSSNQNGLLVDYISDGNYSADEVPPYLLDMSPSSSTPWWDSRITTASLNGTSTFVVPEYGLTIGPIVSATSNSITFNVKLTDTDNVTLSVIVANPAKGMIISKPSGINCGSTCNLSVPRGTSVTLSSQSGYKTFWSNCGDTTTGPTCVTTVNSPMTVSASFISNLLTPNSTSSQQSSYEQTDYFASVLNAIFNFVKGL